MTFTLEEEILSSFLVELGSEFWFQGHPRNVEVSILCILDPISPLVSLDTVNGPIPSILTFNDVEFAIESESHG